jgi:putative transposase
MGHHRCVVSDEAWAWLAPQLPSSAGRRGGRWRDHRQVIEAIAWKYRTGSPWRELPAQFGPWQTAYERLTRGNADGTWGRLPVRAQADVATTAKVAGIRRPIGPHALRRTVGTVGLNQGIPLRDVQRVLRHARPETTLGSYDISGEALERHASHQIAGFLAGWAG